MQKARILKVPNNDSNFPRRQYRYYAQVQRKFLWMKWWSEIDWSYSEEFARQDLDKYFKPKVDTRKTEIIPYP